MCRADVASTSMEVTTPKTSWMSASVTTLQGARVVEFAVLHHDEVVGEAGDLREMVENDSDGDVPRLGEFADKFKHLELVARVEKRDGFVKEEDVRLLGEHHGNPRQLLLAAGEFIERFAAKVVGVNAVDGVLNSLLVLGRRPLVKSRSRTILISHLYGSSFK